VLKSKEFVFQEAMGTSLGHRFSFRHLRILIYLETTVTE